MIKERKAHISDVSKLVECKFIGKDSEIEGLNLVNRRSRYSAVLSYITSEKYLNTILENPSVVSLIVSEKDYHAIKDVLSASRDMSYLISGQPELFFYEIHDLLWEKTEFYNHYNEDPIIGIGCDIHPSAVIESGVVIGNNVQIGPNSVVRKGSVIDDNVIIGCCTVIGSEGFQGIKGFNKCVKHVGRTHICHDVYVGDNSTIGNALFEGETRVGAYSKIDNHVHFAHNCICGEGCFITASSLLMGSTILKDNVWMAPNAVTYNGVVVENNSFVGTMTLAKANVGEGEVVAGIPAKVLRKK